MKLYGVCTQQGPIFIVQELMVNGCLLQFLRQRKELVEKTEIILDMAVQIGSAMHYLEKNGFIHRDLVRENVSRLDATPPLPSSPPLCSSQAARNCLVGERNIVKVADFGLARFVVDDEYTASEGTKFPIKWAAPEVITHAKFSSKSDVWSYGERGTWQHLVLANCVYKLNSSCRHPALGAVDWWQDPLPNLHQLASPGRGADGIQVRQTQALSAGNLRSHEQMLACGELWLK